jgi:hypothetical protein
MIGPLKWEATMTRRRMATLVTWALWLTIASVVARAEAQPDCISLSAVAHPLRFADFPAAPSNHAGPPAKPAVDSAEARTFRTRLREGERLGPNFAGHYTVVGWGCGSACIQFAIVDAQNGRVFFDPTLKSVSVDNVAEAPEPDIRYRLDSRLLVVLGAPNEDQAREGVAFYEWTGSKLKLLRLVRRAEACARR